MELGIASGFSDYLRLHGEEKTKLEEKEEKEEVLESD